MSLANDLGAQGRQTDQRLAASLLANRNLVTLIAITVISIFFQLRWGTIPDTSWLITVCERMLSGERLYGQLHEPNPPFSVWLYLPPVATARMLGIAPEILVQAWVYLTALIAVWFSGAIVKRAGFPETASLLALGPAFYAMLVIFPGNVFSEREHFGVALFMPLLALHAWRARQDAQTQPSFGLAALAGLSGSMLVLVKPYYAVMVLASAVLVAMHRRSLKPIFAVEHWVIGTVCVAYLGAVIQLHPEYLRDIYPLLVELYAQGTAPASVMAYYASAWLFLVFLAWWSWPVGRFPELAAVALAASFAGLFPLFYQAKGWAYHAYPMLFYAVAANLCLLSLPRSGRQSAGLLSRLAAPPRALIALAVMIAFVMNWGTQKPDAALVAAIRATTDRPSVAAISPDLDTGHPLSRMIGGQFVSADVCDWVGGFAMDLYLRALRSGDVAKAAHYRTIMARYAENKRQEFERLRPDIILLKKDDGPWTSQLMEQFGFGAMLARYRLLAEDGYRRVYLRKDYVRPGLQPTG
ncbi:hypothetical protein [Mesorhizobium sp.]|uniref:hypothetical protein n=1 Tax=Mesorhizobium sp. TaxID=1871066 RepID=UPI003BAAE00A